MLTETGEVAKSADGGATWAFVSALSQTGMVGLVRDQGELVAATREGEVAATTDGWVWAWKGSVQQVWVRALASDLPVATGLPPAPPPAVPPLRTWPNPARGPFHLALQLPQEGAVDILVLSPAGRVVAHPVEGEWWTAGRNETSWNPGALSPGVYFMRVRAGGAQRTQRVVWLGR